MKETSLPFFENPEAKSVVQRKKKIHASQKIPSSNNNATKFIPLSSSGHASSIDGKSSSMLKPRTEKMSSVRTPSQIGKKRSYKPFYELPAKVRKLERVELVKPTLCAAAKLAAQERKRLAFEYVPPAFCTRWSYHHSMLNISSDVFDTE